jgi:hypothetical protein
MMLKRREGSDDAPAEQCHSAVVFFKYVDCDQPGTSCLLLKINVSIWGVSYFIIV